MAKKQTFEKAMERLEQIVDDLESGDPLMDAAIKKFEEGVKLSKFCTDKLDEMEKRITILSENDGGALIEEPLASDTDQDNSGLPI